MSARSLCVCACVLVCPEHEAHIAAAAAAGGVLASCWLLPMGTQTHRTCWCAHKVDRLLRGGSPLVSSCCPACCTPNPRETLYEQQHGIS